MNHHRNDNPIDDIDRLIITETEAGLPLCPEPYEAVAQAIGISSAEVQQRLTRMQESGIIRRIGLVPNHYALGYKANGMSVWDVEDDRAMKLGKRIGALDFVSHCYLRPRHMPDWPYNLFAMVHGRDRDEVAGKVRAVAAELGDALRGFDILYSTRILKKTGFRLSREK